MPKINLRESVDRLDKETFCKDDLLNMYDCCEFSDADKVKLVEMFNNGKDKYAAKFIKEAFENKYKGVQMICNPSPDDFNASLGEEIDDEDIDTDYYGHTTTLDDVKSALERQNESEFADRVEYGSENTPYKSQFYIPVYTPEEERYLKLRIKSIYKDNSFTVIPDSVKSVESPVDGQIGIVFEVNSLSDDDLDEEFIEAYGGAFDIEDDQYFTRDDLNEFTYYVIKEVENNLDVHNIEPSGTYIDNKVLDMTLSFEGCEESLEKRIDMRKIRTPEDLINRYSSIFIEYFTDFFQQVIYNKEVLFYESEPLVAPDETEAIDESAEFDDTVDNKRRYKYRTIKLPNGNEYTIEMVQPNEDEGAVIPKSRMIPVNSGNKDYVWAEIVQDGEVVFRIHSRKIDEMQLWPYLGDEYDTSDEYLDDIYEAVAKSLDWMNSDTYKKN